MAWLNFSWQTVLKFGFMQLHVQNEGNFYHSYDQIFSPYLLEI